MSKFIDWIKTQAPSRESWEGNRFLRPFARRIFAPELWRFTRRSVPRGVALGLFVGIFLMVPGLQMFPAALLALTFRANVPVAVAMTFVSMPFTTPFILAGSIYLGNLVLNSGADVSSMLAMINSGASIWEWMGWMVRDAAPALLLGLFMLALGAAILGYVVATLGWRFLLTRRWKSRSWAKKRPIDAS